MDKSRFDDIIKSRLESYEDPAKPSGAEISQLFNDLPSTSGGGSSISNTLTTLNKILIVTSSILTLTLIYFIYRTYSLQETLGGMQDEIQEIAQAGQDVVILYDTVAMDSIVALRNMVDQLSDRFDQNAAMVGELRRVNNELGRSLSDFQMTPEDSALFVEQVRAELVATLNANPDLFKDVFGSFRQTENTQPTKQPIDRRVASTTRSFKEKGLLTPILSSLLADSAQSKVLSSLWNNQDPDIPENDRLGYDVFQPLTEEVLVELPEDSKQQLMNSFIAYDPEPVKSAAMQYGADSASVAQLNILVVERKNDPLLKRDSLVMAQRELAKTRIEQYKEPSRMWLGGGAGVGAVPTKSVGTVPVGSFKLGAEFQPNDRFGFLFGTEFYGTAAETHDVESQDFSEFDNIEAADLSGIKELKVGLVWMDIPLEARLYITPDRKVNPYLQVSVRARAMLSQNYKFETHSGSDINAEFEKEYSFIVPAFGYGAGAQIHFTPRVKGAFQINHSIGGEDQGPMEDHYNTLQGQATLFFKLK